MASTSGTELATASVNLTTAVVNLLNKGGVAGDIVVQIARWIAREGLSDTEFKYCLDEIKGYMCPNEYGLTIKATQHRKGQIKRTTERLSGMQLINAGSIARWMAMDPQYCWVITTTAALLVCHDMPYATSAIRDMIVDGGQHDLTDREQAARLRKARLYPVLQKIVDSATLHIVNSGSSFGGLPASTADICRHGVEAYIFAYIAVSLYQSTSDIVVHSARFPADVFMWVITHIEGRIKLVVGNNSICDERFGTSSRRITFIVDGTCIEPLSGHEQANTKISISESVHNSTQWTSWSGPFKMNEAPNNPVSRQELYHTNFAAPGSHYSLLTRAELHRVELVGQGLVRWMMAVPIKLPPANVEQMLIVSTTRRETNRDECILVEELLARRPTICNVVLDSTFRFAGLRESDRSLEDLEGDRYEEYRDGPLEEEIRSGKVLASFPDVGDILEQVGRRCNCQNCCNGDADDGTSAPGCLRYIVKNQLLMLVAHAVADGFGAPDVSGMRDFTHFRLGVQRLLSSFVADQRMSWKLWFSVAACMYLGCPWPEPSIQNTEDHSCGELIAAQLGSLAVAASWVNMDLPIRLAGSFGFQAAQAQIQGVEAEYGLLYEDTPSTENGIRAYALSEKPRHEWFEPDDCTCEKLTAIIRLTGPCFLLMTVIESGPFLRIVQPSDMVSSLLSSKALRCDHKQTKVRDWKPPQVYRIWNFEEVLGFWEAHNDDQDCHVEDGVGPPPNDTRLLATYYTTSLDCDLKNNVALSFSRSGCIVKDEKCCLACAEAKLPPPNVIDRGPARRILILSRKSQQLTRRTHP